MGDAYARFYLFIRGLLSLFPLLAVLSACDVDIKEQSSARQIEAWFNYPITGKGDSSVVVQKDFLPEEKLVELVEEASENSTIHVSLYLFTRRAFSDSIKKAALERGVETNIIIEDGWRSITAAQKEIIAELEAFEGRQGKKLIHIIRCNKGCIGRVINHNKFFLFSSSGDSKNIVVQSSANLTEATGRLFENSIVFRNDEELYNTYMSYWNDLARRKKNPAYADTLAESHGDASEGIRVYFFPQKKGDILLDLLSPISCESGSSLKITVSNWDFRRKLDKKLVELAKQGCSVVALIPDNPAKTDCSVRANLYPNIQLYTANKLPHSKYIVYEGVYRGVPARILWTGSHNYTWHSLRSTDEALLQIRVDSVVDQYLENWNAMITYATLEHGLDSKNADDNSCYQHYISAQKGSGV